MTTRHVLDQLPLWVEGDLDQRDADAVQAHLDACPNCQAAAAHLRTSQAWLRDAMASPFSAMDREQLRRAVLDRIRAEAPRQPVRRLVVRSTLLATCAAALLLAVLTWRPGRPVAPSLPGVGIPATAPVIAAPAQPESVMLQTPPRSARAAPRTFRTRSAPGPAAPPREEPARIEFQTPDPTVHIIWLARATPLPEAHLPLQETP